MFLYFGQYMLLASLFALSILSVNYKFAFSSYILNRLEMEKHHNDLCKAFSFQDLQSMINAFRGNFRVIEMPFKHTVPSLHSDSSFQTTVPNCTAYFRLITWFQK